MRKRTALAEFYRFHAVRGSARPVPGGMTPGTRRATGDYVPMLAHAMSGPMERSPLRIPARSKAPRTPTDDEVSQLQEARRRLRDRFLVILRYESGLRIGEALGLQHADLDPAVCAVVAREDNPNQARVKGMKDRAVPVRDYLFNRYASYLDAEYGDLDSDFVFQNPLF